MYHYEALGDERFQELCQALITKDHPTAQCLPVGQPDGGRDAFALRTARAQLEPKGELIVFQVKFARNATGTREEREMVESVIRTEKRKVERLKAAGLTKYYLITNVKGTAHLEVGSIDRVNKLLSEAFGVEAYCWWRDDLDRRMDGNASVKWSYPDILKATDLLGALVYGSLGEDEERRRSAVRAYITDQYEDDQELKFKQTDLRSSMTELFVDLPMSESLSGIDEDTQVVARGGPPVFGSHNHLFFYREKLLAAEYILKPPAGHISARILLEGAPGQGKSTVTQYVCQLLRMQLLDKHDDLGRVADRHRNFRARIPFKVDLRDLAKWLSGVDPFQPKPVELGEHEVRSLEGFLAAQVRHASGGATFTVSDLIAVAKASHILLALDGFDEVANIEMRSALVKEITKSSSRLMNAGGYSVQTIVTSRPAAFAKSVRFPREQWAYFELLPLERGHVDSYTEKWMTAKSLKASEKASLVRVLEEKLKEAHTQYLAKNPMQLTILLSLINNRGASLPEKRTALYDAYMDMFFSRESEKSDIVRDNRELLVDIHRFLAWKLQTSAENGDNGSIEHGALRVLLFSYLDEQGEDTSIVSALFDGIIERVGALVSRVQETYEFEVQPLREYFAARHLYETAPYSAAGSEKVGTKLDRFRALVANPYWLNVARFYGGCFSKGEVSALVDELSELADGEEYGLTSHAQTVALMFLADWVFTQYQPAVKRIVELIGAGHQLKRLLAAEQGGSLSWPPLPDRSGRGDLVEKLWGHYLKSDCADEQAALADAIAGNSNPAEMFGRWLTSREHLSEEAWTLRGVRLGLFRTLPDAVLNALPSPLRPEVVSSFLSAQQFELLERSPETKDAAVKSFLEGAVVLGVTQDEYSSSASELAWIAVVLSPYQYGMARSDTSGAPLQVVMARRFGGPNRGRRTRRPEAAFSALPSRLKSPVNAYEKFLATPTSTLASSTAPWSDLVEALRASWGDCLAVDRIACIAAGVRARNEAGHEQSLVSADNLVAAARFARLKSGAPRWWRETLNSSRDDEEFVRHMLILWVWGTKRTLLTLLEAIDQRLRILDQKLWLRLISAFRYVHSYTDTSNRYIEVFNREELKQLQNKHARTLMLFGSRMHMDARYDCVPGILGDGGASAPELQFAMDATIHACRTHKRWRKALPLAERLYERGAVARASPSKDDLGIDKESAVAISRSLGSYPLAMVATADSKLKALAGERSSKLLDVATRERWFSGT